jgi:Nucleotidyltransferase domain
MPAEQTQNDDQNVISITKSNLSSIGLINNKVEFDVPVTDSTNSLNVVLPDSSTTICDNDVDDATEDVRNISTTTKKKKKSKNRKKKKCTINNLQREGETTVDDFEDDITSPKSFRKWIHSLSWKELQSALEFEIEWTSDEMINTSLRFSNQKLSRQHYSMQQKDNNGRNGQSEECKVINSRIQLSKQEFNLLLEMIRMLPCPPIPIHPKATAGLLFNVTNIDDGRVQEVMKRKYQLERPRFFRWIEQQQQSTTMDEFMTTEYNSNFNHYNINSNLRRSDLLMSTTSNSSSSRVGTNIKSDYGNYNNNSKVMKSFDVIARKFVTEDGERLTLGCTSEQQNSDEAILRGTIFRYQPCNDKKINETGTTHQPYCVSLEIFDDPSNLSFSTLGKIELLGEVKNMQQYVIRLLDVVTRGNFGTVSPYMVSSNQQPNHIGQNQQYEQQHKKSTARENSLFLVPWFNPEKRWFSLSMYLANCFELALWDAFSRSFENKRNEPLQSNIEQDTTTIPDDKRKKLLYKAISQTMVTILEEERRCIVMNSVKLKIRDNLVWYSVMHDSVCMTSSTQSLHNKHVKDSGVVSEKALWMCQALEFESKSEQWKFCIRQHFRKLISTAVQELVVRELLRQLEHDETLNINNDSDETHKIVNIKLAYGSAVGNLTSNRGKKSSKVKKFIPKIRQTIQQYETNEDTCFENQQNDNNSFSNRQEADKNMQPLDSTSSSSVDEEIQLSSESQSEWVTKHKYSFPSSRVTHRDRNKNIVIALSVLDVVLNRVYKEVGVSETDSNQEQDSEGNIIMPTVSADDDDFQLVGKSGRAKAKVVIGITLSNKSMPKQEMIKAKQSESLSQMHIIHDESGRSRYDDSANQNIPTNVKYVDLSDVNINVLDSTIMSTSDDHQPRIVTHAQNNNGTTIIDVNIENTSEQFHSCSPNSTNPLPLPDQKHNHFPNILSSESARKEWRDQQQYVYQGQQFQYQQPCFIEDSCTTIKRSNTDSSSLRHEHVDYFMTGSWGPFQTGDCYSGADGWSQQQRYGFRAQSILSDFFQTQLQSDEDITNQDEDIMASSTAASIASSTKLDESCDLGEDLAVAFPKEIENNIVVESVPTNMDALQYFSAPDCERSISENGEERCNAESFLHAEDKIISESNFKRDALVCVAKTETGTKFPCSSRGESRESEYETSPSPPITPSSSLSPILVSLSELSNMRKDTIEKSASYEHTTLNTIRSFGSEPPSSVANSPARPASDKITLVSSLSRENLRAALIDDKSGGNTRGKTKKKSIASPRPTRIADLGTSRNVYVATQTSSRSRDDYDIKCKGPSVPRRSVDTLSSYRNTTTRSVVSRDDHDINPKMTRDTPSRFPSYKSMVAKGPGQMHSSWSSIKTAKSESARRSSRNFHPTSSIRNPKEKDSSTQSETAIEERNEYQNWHESYRSPMNEDFDNNTTTKDASTTIVSAPSHRELDETYLLREERNSYRDMCLTLGAEVAKLKNMLAAQMNTTRHQSMEYPPGCVSYPPHNTSYLDPESVSHHAFQIAPRARTLAAMSDTGYGEHESLASDDDTNTARMLTGDGLRQSSSLTITGSDASLDPTSVHHAIHMPYIGIKPTRDGPDPVSLNGMQSRLTKDVLQFLESINAQLLKQDSKRRLAVERMTRLVNTLWPRAQVKLYGSHVTGLCLPSSDLDFVVCLPAVHKNTIAIAAGELEVRTAINESSQKLLARRLQGESWIDPRSMKLIERTVVPVIKVSTKDTRARMLQLDITFDAPGHHGREAVVMVNKIMEEIPMIRPIIIVLKQFLLDRGLLTAYTGGLSSYCLFLMVARYLQEQPSSWGDCGALLMGFLDFYGNFVSI